MHTENVCYGREKFYSSYYYLHSGCKVHKLQIIHQDISLVTKEWCFDIFFFFLDFGHKNIFTKF